MWMAAAILLASASMLAAVRWLRFWRADSWRLALFNGLSFALCLALSHWNQDRPAMIDADEQRPENYLRDVPTRSHRGL